MRFFVTAKERAALKRLMPLLELNKLHFAAAVMLGALGLGASIGLGATAAWLIARASQMPPVLYLTVATVGVRFFGVSKAVLRYVQRLASHHVAINGIADLRENVYRKLASRKTDAIARLKRGDLLERTGSDVDALGDLLVKSVLPAWVAGVAGVGTVLGIALLSPAAALILGGALILSGVVGPLLTARYARLAELADEKARTELASQTLTLVDNYAELAVSGQMSEVRSAIHTTELELTKVKDQAARPAAVAAAIDHLAMGLAVIGAILVGIPQMHAGSLAAVALAVLVLVPLSAFEGTADLGPAAVQLIRSARAAVRIDEILSSDEAPQSTPITGVETGPVLRAENLSVGWPGGPVVATGINLELKPGSHLAIVGPSGIGKSTILFTLAGMLEPRAGRVTLDGTDVYGAAREDVGARLSLTPEDAHIFATTVLENIRAAQPSISEDEARALLDRAGLAQWANSLPEGLSTMLGSGGTTVSGGERRRLLLARALGAPAPLLLIDEPGEHVDNETADLLIEDLLGVPESGSDDRAVLVVTHRLTPLGNADEVLVLSSDGDGPATIVARGKHDQLIRENDSYRWALEREGSQKQLEN
ncbi:MAG: thiol reductant ABC exporter subunit CydC [Actinomycetaceae bacterium]|nr:thiol reductant ABC exporter subunit CydC [Actinomycetaceae bacterium]